MVTGETYLHTGLSHEEMDSREAPIEYAYNGNEGPSEAVITAVSAASNREPLEMDPLYESIDPEALDALFRSHSNDDSDSSDIQIEFRIESNHVTVTADHVHVHRSDEA